MFVPLPLALSIAHLVDLKHKSVNHQKSNGATHLSFHIELLPNLFLSMKKKKYKDANDVVDEELHTINTV